MGQPVGEGNHSFYSLNSFLCPAEIGPRKGEESSFRQHRKAADARIRYGRVRAVPGPLWRGFILANSRGWPIGPLAMFPPPASLIVLKVSSFTLFLKTNLDLPAPSE